MRKSGRQNSSRVSGHGHGNSARGDQSHLGSAISRRSLALAKRFGVGIKSGESDFAQSRRRGVREKRSWSRFNFHRGSAVGAYPGMISRPYRRSHFSASRQVGQTFSTSSQKRFE